MRWMNTHLESNWRRAQVPDGQDLRNLLGEGPCTRCVSTSLIASRKGRGWAYTAEAELGGLNLDRHGGQR